MKARTAVGRGKERPLFDPGLSYYREGAREHESSARIINGAKKKL